MHHTSFYHFLTIFKLCFQEPFSGFLGFYGIYGILWGLMKSMRHSLKLNDDQTSLFLEFLFPMNFRGTNVTYFASLVPGMDGTEPMSLFMCNTIRNNCHYKGSNNFPISIANKYDIWLCQWGSPARVTYILFQAELYAFIHLLACSTINP